MTKKIFFLILAVFAGITMSGWTGAMLIPAAQEAREKAKADNSPAIEEAQEHWVLTPPGLEKIVFVHHQKDFAKPPWAGEGKPQASKCYDFLGKGVKWQELPVSYVIDPDNLDGLSEDFVAQAISGGVEGWDGWTGAELFNDNYSIVYDASWDSDAPDGRNELLFGNYPEDGIIAVTVVWGYFSGPTSLRKIIEFDVLFDTDFVWGDGSINSSVMDLQNIATHELGHGVGLADIYQDDCAEVTMYGYSNYGETKKRTLETPDITGLQKLYGGL